MAAGALYTTAKACRDCGEAIDTSTAANTRYCARDRQRRRAITFGRQMVAVLHAMPQDHQVSEARSYLAAALSELGEEIGT